MSKNNAKPLWTAKGADGRYQDPQGWDASNDDADSVCTAFVPILEGSEVVALVVQASPTYQTTLDDVTSRADRIVRCVNGFDKLREALAGLIGSGDKDELRQMELAVRTTPASDADKAVALNAIHALLETAE